MEMQKPPRGLTRSGFIMLDYCDVPEAAEGVEVAIGIIIGVEVAGAGGNGGVPVPLNGS